MGWTTAYKTLVADSGHPTTVYVGLYNGDPEGAGTELTGGGYSRQSMTPAAAFVTGTAARTSNNGDVVFTATGNMGTATYGSIHSAATGGTLYVGDALSASRSMVTGATLTFVTGAIDLDID